MAATPAVGQMIGTRDINWFLECDNKHVFIKVAQDSASSRIIATTRVETGKAMHAFGCGTLYFIGYAV